MKRILYFLFSMVLVPCWGQGSKESEFIRTLYDQALEGGRAYEDLRFLCKEIGHRITGSAQAEMAVEWGRQLMQDHQFDTVYLQEFTAPHWERGTAEAGWITTPDGIMIKVKLAALGGSVGTNGLLEAEVVAFDNPEAMNKAPEEEIEGKIVFFSQAFDPRELYTFNAYSGCVSIRWDGAAEATKKGAVAVLIRSLAQQDDEHPHTGVMNTEGARIPAAALSSKDANTLLYMVDQPTPVVFKFEMDCGFREEVTTYNVIGELHGEKDEIITWGGHLDSWDLGEGAHDDGAGVIHSLEAMRLLKSLNYQPRHTLRCVLFMNEENGNFGGKAYAAEAVRKKEIHIAAVESDRGGFMPVGFDVRGSDRQLKWVREIAEPLSEFRLWRFEKGYGGVDIGPLYEAYPDMLQLGLNLVSQRYFDYHHAETDVFETVNKRELEFGCAAMASMIYLLDQNLN
ncbi:MAG: Uncharacterised protein [Flavobacteriia bacterium]|nr:MAG: Uncharacterised protein [Flavobacteriia bacterium]